MSVLGALAGLMAGGGTPWAPPAQEDTPPPGQVVDQLPTLDDQLASSLRPDGRRIGLLTVGASGRDHTTIREALARAVQMQRASASADGAQWPQVVELREMARMRDYLTVVLVDPGDYAEGGTQPLLVPPHVAIIAADGGHSSVRIGVGVDTLGWAYLEGLHVRPPRDGTAGKYVSHHANRGTTIWSRCTLDTDGRSGGLGGDTPIGADGINDGHLTLHDVTLTGGTYTNLHGRQDLLRPEEVCFVRCRYDDGTLHYAALTDAVACQVWAVDCEARSVTTLGAAVDLHVAGGAYDLPPSPTDARADWPIPTGGISPTWRAILTA